MELEPSANVEFTRTVPDGNARNGELSMRCVEMPSDDWESTPNQK